MNKSKKLREDAEYDFKYGKIPNDEVERVEYIMGVKFNTDEFKEGLKKKAKEIQRIKWKEIEFTMWKLVKPSARPRHSQRNGYIQTYVPHAKENGDWFEHFFWDNDLPIIDTPCIVDMDIYERTPAGFKRRDVILAEMGIIRPWKRTGDVDNYAKAVLDMIQHGMLAEDCLVQDCNIHRRYSIKPRVTLRIKYMEKWPELDEVVTGLGGIKPL